MVVRIGPACLWAVTSWRLQQHMCIRSLETDNDATCHRHGIPLMRPTRCATRSAHTKRATLPQAVFDHGNLVRWRIVPACPPSRSSISLILLQQRTDGGRKKSKKKEKAGGKGLWQPMVRRVGRKLAEEPASGHLSAPLGALSRRFHIVVEAVRPICRLQTQACMPPHQKTAGQSLRSPPPLQLFITCDGYCAWQRHS